jgi:hypothetical protein
MDDLSAVQEIKDLYDNLFDSALKFRRNQDKIISDRVKVLLDKYTRNEISLEELIVSYDDLNNELLNEYKEKSLKDSLIFRKIDSKMVYLSTKDRKEIKRYSKKISKAIKSLSGVNSDLKRLIRIVKKDMLKGIKSGK